MYTKTYPGAQIVSTELSAQFSERAKSMHKSLKESDSENYRAIRNKTCQLMRDRKGNSFVHSDETKKKMSASHTGKTREPHTEQTKQLLSKQKIGKPVNLSDKSKQAKSEKQKANWETRREDSKQFSKYIELLSTRRRDYIKEHGIVLPKRGKKTNIEKQFIEFLDANSIQYIYQYPLDGKYYDFYLQTLNLLVEVDGEYWHRFPAAIRNDLEKHSIAKDHKLKLLRITHTNWVPELVFETDYNLIQKHNHQILNSRTKECQNYEISISIV